MLSFVFLFKAVFLWPIPPKPVGPDPGCLEMPGLVIVDVASVDIGAGTARPEPSG